MNDNEELQRELTTVALTALDGRAFALAGSGAIREHGMVDRLTHDVDLFTNDLDPAAFEGAVDQLTNELQRVGHGVEEVRRSAQFAQLRITTPEGRIVDMDLAVDWRENDPVIFSVGPVLSVEDAVGGKVSALYTRNEARDYIDVDSIRASGRFTDAELMSAARERDAGFEVGMFAQQLDQVQRIDPRRFEEYGVDAVQLAAITGRFGQWAAELRTPTPTADQPAVLQTAVQQLDLEFQHIVDVNKVDYPSSATEIRFSSPEDTTEGCGSRRPPELGRSTDHGYGR
ncbi:nucleotidyl transferase AbiEii/AbiGii toxin family protein [Glaciihabitans sp. UYNi722]|uniref:nucleotidyl transferase AbiEii/AbiGii toxin family protein n=1 Tax=Glaciihabitans sp. UYNi722 TaxID=3156344 RepID=UPI00339161C7